MLRYNFFIVFIMLNIPLLGMYQDQPSAYSQQLLIIIPNKPEYKKLEDKFGTSKLRDVLYNYQHGYYCKDNCFKAWSVVADSVIGQQYVEEQRRYFLVNIMLHAQQNGHGLKTLYDSFSNKHFSPTFFSTPQGPVHTQLELWEYDQAMAVCNDIRTKLFTGGNINPFILVRKFSNEMAPAVKWSLFKGFAVISYLISSLCSTKKKDEEENNKKDANKLERDHFNDSLFSLFALSDIVQKAEEDIHCILEEYCPELKDYDVKSLIDDKSSWLYDRKNWIFCGSLSCMALLLLCLFCGKIPHIHRAFAFVVIT